MWPFTSAYPERRAEEVDGKTFDYIVVGGKFLTLQPSPFPSNPVSGSKT